MSDAEPSPVLPTELQFGDRRFVREGHLLWQGHKRIVLPMRDAVTNEPVVAKLEKRGRLLPNVYRRWEAVLLRMLRLDENAREWRFLSRNHDRASTHRFFPRPIARGISAGLSTIIVEGVYLRGRPCDIGEYVQCASTAELNQLHRRLDELQELMVSHHMVCNDLRISNIVIRGEGGVHCPVVIDGFGNNLLVPYPVFSKRLNGRKIERRIKRLKARLTSARPGPSS